MKVIEHEGVVVSAGSSGRVDQQRARVLAEQGFLALAIRWFGGPEQPAGICEVPLETFVAAVDLLRSHGAGRVGMWSVCNVGPGLDGRRHPYRSSWTWRGRPLPFVPLDDSWSPPSKVTARGDPWLVRAERANFRPAPGRRRDRGGEARADVLLVAGADDAMWPSLRYARQLAARRHAADAPVEVVARDDAGHRPGRLGAHP